MRQLLVALSVSVPADIDDDDVLDAIHKMLDVGAADAAESAADDELDPWARAEARKAAALEIGHPQLLA